LTRQRLNESGHPDDRAGQSPSLTIPAGVAMIAGTGGQTNGASAVNAR